MASFPLTPVDSGAVDDSEPLLEIVGDARVVAVGEANHHVREFGLLRNRVVRLLVERAGFGVVAVEPGFAGARAVAEWLRSGPGDLGGPGDLARVASAGLGYRFGEAAEMQELLRWLRGRDVAFSGLDVPGSGDSPAEVWPDVAAFVREVDPGALELVAEAERATGAYAALNSGLALARYSGLERSVRDAGAAAVSAVLAFVAAARPVGPGHTGSGRALALHQARGAWRWYQFLRELTAMGAGSSWLGLGSSRDAYMADSVRWLLEEHGPGARVVVSVHNGHAQRCPVRLPGAPPMLPMGDSLAA